MSVCIFNLVAATWCAYKVQLSYMYIYMYVYMYIYMYVYLVCVQGTTFIHVYLYVCIHVYLYVCILGVRTRYSYTCMHVQVTVVECESVLLRSQHITYAHMFLHKSLHAGSLGAFQTSGFANI
jgi:hypothetical protein